MDNLIMVGQWIAGIASAIIAGVAVTYICGSDEKRRQIKGILSLPIKIMVLFITLIPTFIFMYKEGTPTRNEIVTLVFSVAYFLIWAFLMILSSVIERFMKGFKSGLEPRGE